MPSLASFILLAHLLGLALGMGCATAKLTLLLRCRSDPTFVQAYISVTRPLTRWIVLGLSLLTLSGVGWLLLGYRLTPLLVAKLVLVGAIWVLGPVIDNIVEPKFRKLAPAVGESPARAFVEAQRRYLLLETVATGLFYMIVAMWVLG
jgi:hypothetical protein